MGNHDAHCAVAAVHWKAARIQGARRILEIGTLGRYSTIWVARVLPLTHHNCDTHHAIYKQLVQDFAYFYRLHHRIGRLHQFSSHYLSGCQRRRRNARRTGLVDVGFGDRHGGKLHRAVAVLPQSGANRLVHARSGATGHGLVGPEHASGDSGISILLFADYH